jgi:multidrug efflux pump subunit AcrA (membrane-fusion protein)
MRGKWALVSVAAVLAGVAGGVFSLWHRHPAPALPVRAAGAAVLLPANQVTLSGTIRPQHVVGVGTQIDGVIDAFLVDVGQDVYQGQVLARIGSQGLDSSREAAASAVDHAQERVNQAETVVVAAWNNPARTPKRNAPVSTWSARKPPVRASSCCSARALRRAWSMRRRRANTTARGPSSR